MGNAYWRIRPTTVVELSCLLALAVNDACANDVAGAVRFDSNGALTMSRETARQALMRMSEVGMVTVIAKDSKKHNEKVMYGLTDFGREQLRMEIERLADVVALGRHRLAGIQADPEIQFDL
jgi:DNA-binding PadR family transcriptional regulator